MNSALKKKKQKQRWSSNPKFLGSYSFNTTGTGQAEREALSQPVNGSTPLQLLFAGEATHATLYSSVNAAYESGMREANRLLQLTVLYRNSLYSIGSAYCNTLCPWSVYHRRIGAPRPPPRLLTTPTGCGIRPVPNRNLNRTCAARYIKKRIQYSSNICHDSSCQERVKQHSWSFGAAQVV